MKVKVKDIVKLDNPVWYSLLEYQQPYSLDFGNVKYYHPDYCAFGAFANSDNDPDAIDAYGNLIDDFFIVGRKPVIPVSSQIKTELVCLQMVHERDMETEYKNEIVELGHGHMDALMALVKIVFPEYFKKKTALLGRYFGIFKNNLLVAITGERMQMQGFTEVSGVVTHPDHVGNGYASQLVAHTVNKIIEAGKIPFLHVAENNATAIRLYQKQGFETRRKMSFWNVVRSV